jgi:cytochrome P450
MLPDSIQYVTDADEVLTDPIQVLTRARERYGNLFAIRKEGPLFSRATDSAGVVAAFGLDNQRTVLTDIESFVLPVSAAENLNLSRSLVNLNRSLHSMRGAEHATQKRLLVGMLASLEPSQQLICDALEEATANWTERPVALVQQLRELVFRASLRVLFGDENKPIWQLASLLQTYFHLRRDTTSTARVANEYAVEQLVETGNILNAELRDFIRKRKDRPIASSAGVLANLANDRRFSEDEIVGHMNVFFISTTEPVAVALSWILLVLSQLPELRLELRKEIQLILQADTCPVTAQLNKLVLLDRVISETLRLLPPNALMVRITTKPTLLNGVSLPSRCEVVLSPFISHRDGTVFPNPSEFLPHRWQGAPPSPYVYFPFGAGGHSCVGRGIAIDMIKTILAFLLPRFDLLLVEDQELDFAIRIQFMPSPDPAIIFQPARSQRPAKPGLITGPLAKLMKLETMTTSFQHKRLIS